MNEWSREIVCLSRTLTRICGTTENNSTTPTNGTNLHQRNFHLYSFYHFSQQSRCLYGLRRADPPTHPPYLIFLYLHLRPVPSVGA